MAKRFRCIYLSSKPLLKLLSIVNKCSITTGCCELERKITFFHPHSILTANADIVNLFNRVIQAEYKENQFLGATVFSRDGILLVRQE